MDKPMKKSEKQKIAVFIFIFIIAAAMILYLISIKPKAQTQTDTTNVQTIDVNQEYSIESEDVQYYKNYVGYMARPSAEGQYPGVIMIHEWWGLNDNIKEMADKLASQGFVVLAVDLYGESTTDSAKAGQLAGAVRSNENEAIENMRAAISRLIQEDVTKIGSLGWCFGGGQSLQISLNEYIDATVIYYGNLVTDKSELQKLNGPVLGIFGRTDTSIPVSTVGEFDAALDEINKSNEIYIYDGVGHAFANPSGANYAPEQTADAWKKTLAFLNENLN